MDGAVHAHIGNRRESGEFRLHCKPRQLTGYFLLLYTRLSVADASGNVYLFFSLWNVLGLGAAICAVLTSGLAGVLCEYLLKAGSRHVTMSIRNIQLGVPSCLLGLVAFHFQENEKLLSGGFFQGFTSWTWTVIVRHSLGRVHRTIIKVNLTFTNLHLDHIVSLIHFFHRRLARDSSDEVR